MVLLEYLLTDGPASAAAFVGIGTRNSAASHNPNGRPAAGYLAYLDALFRDRPTALKEMAAHWSADASVDPEWLMHEASRADLLTQVVGLVGLACADYSNRLAPFGIPTVHIHGVRDAQVPSASGDVLADLVGAERVRIDGVGHMPFLEAPEMFDDAIAALRSRVVAGGAGSR